MTPMIGHGDFVVFNHHESCKNSILIIPQCVVLERAVWFEKGHIRFTYVYVYTVYTGCPRGNVPNFGRVFLMLNYTEKTQNTYVR
jgi:hypothetical protein